MDPRFEMFVGIVPQTSQIPAGLDRNSTECIKRAKNIQKAMPNML
jgi:hypothetical protein